MGMTGKIRDRKPWPIWLRILLAGWLCLIVAFVVRWLGPDIRVITVTSPNTCVFQGREVPCGGPLVEKVTDGHK